MLTRKAACHLHRKVACLAKNNASDGAECVFNQNADKETNYSAERQQTRKLQVQCNLLWGFFAAFLCWLVETQSSRAAISVSLPPPTPTDSTRNV